MRKQTHRPLAAILLGGMIAATIDIGAACLINDRSVPFILHTIAGGIWGRGPTPVAARPRCWA